MRDAGIAPHPAPNVDESADRTKLYRMHIVDKVYHQALAYLAERGDWKPSLYEMASDLGIHTELLRKNPKVVSLLAMHTPGIESMLGWTIREWLGYHNEYVHQAYRYDFPELQQTWMGRTAIKNVLDAWVQQEIIFRTRPEVLIELGVMFGGSTLFFAHMLDLAGIDGKVVGIDVTLSKVKDVSHPKVEFIESSSVDESLVADLYTRFGDKNVMVVADSNHEMHHVLRELEMYSGLIKPDSYYIVEDGIADLLDLHPVPMDGAFVAIQKFLTENDSFVSDELFGERFILTNSPSGYLRKVK